MIGSNATNTSFVGLFLIPRGQIITTATNHIDCRIATADVPPLSSPLLVICYTTATAVIPELTPSQPLIYPPTYTPGDDTNGRRHSVVMQKGWNGHFRYLRVALGALEGLVPGSAARAAWWASLKVLNFAA